MKNKLFTLVLALCLLSPVSQAHAQGWPTFDVAKLASLISNLIGRFQPVPQVLSRVNQVKSTLEQIQAAGQAALSGDLKAIGEMASKHLNSAKKSKIDEQATGANGAQDASKFIKDSLYADSSMTKEAQAEVREERAAIAKEAKKEILAKTFNATAGGGGQSAERFKKADEAMSSAETIHDSINANTLMIMAGNYDMLAQISLKIAKMKSDSAEAINDQALVPPKKPTPPKFADGSSVEEKDEIDVKF